LFVLLPGNLQWVKELRLERFGKDNRVCSTRGSDPRVFVEAVPNVRVGGGLPEFRGGGELRN